MPFKRWSDPGDEAIIFDPAYDAYEPAVRLAGGRCVRVPLTPAGIRLRLGSRARLFERPHAAHHHQQPAESELHGGDPRRSGRARRAGARPAHQHSRPMKSTRTCCSTAGGTPRCSRIAELRERSFAVFSFGKALHATGWRTGYCVAPPALTRELRKVHQFNTFSIVAPLQHAIARYLARCPDAWTGLSAFFQAKRDLLAGLLRGSGFEPLPAAGTYFLLVDYGALSRSRRHRFRRPSDPRSEGRRPFRCRLSTHAPPSMTLLRLCLAKRDETLKQAAERLRAFAARALRELAGPEARPAPTAGSGAGGFATHP